MAVSEDDVFAEIGRALLSDTFGTTKLSDAEASTAGRAWFATVLPVLRGRVCGNAAVEKALLTEGAAARNTALTAALDTALAGLFHGIPVTTIANAVILYGVHTLCPSS
jgi:hypothetical protein